MFVQLNACPGWAYIEVCGAQSQILQTQMHSRLGKSALNFENKDGIECRETKKWWLTTYILTFKSKRSHPLVRATSVKVD